MKRKEMDELFGEGTDDRLAIIYEQLYGLGISPDDRAQIFGHVCTALIDPKRKRRIKARKITPLHMTLEEYRKYAK